MGNDNTKVHTSVYENLQVIKYKKLVTDYEAEVSDMQKQIDAIPHISVKNCETVHKYIENEQKIERLEDEIRKYHYKNDNIKKAYKYIVHSLQTKYECTLIITSMLKEIDPDYVVQPDIIDMLLKECREESPKYVDEKYNYIEVDYYFTRKERISYIVLHDIHLYINKHKLNISDEALFKYGPFKNYIRYRINMIRVVNYYKSIGKDVCHLITF